MTLIVLLILAAVSLGAVFSDKGVFKRAENAGEKYNEAKAREVLETVLLADGQYEKNLNPDYNQNDFLDELIKSEIPGSDVKGDVAIIGEYAYELDRSVPKIGRYLGNPKDLVWPTVNAMVQLADDEKNATINITAKEEKNGINKIEIWILGEKIEEYTYDPSKPEAIENYIATQNGKYTIKAYGDLMDSTTVEVTGIVASVKFEPNGDEDWKKEHSTVVTIQETADKVASSKYYWSKSVTTPDDDKFTEEFKSGDTITNNELTETYYLWTMLTTQSGKILKWRSDGFNFDNQGPNITSLTYTAVSYSSFKLNVTAIDSQSGIVKYEFFVGESKKGEKTVNEVKTSNSQELTISDATYGENSCYVIVTDKLGHTTRQDIIAKTLIDTTGPTVTFSTAKYSLTGITYKVTAQDTGVGLTKIEFYDGSTLKSTYTKTYTATTVSKTETVNITGLTTGTHTCKVIAYDSKNNKTEKIITNASTMLYTWEKWEVNTSIVVHDTGWVSKGYITKNYSDSDFTNTYHSTISTGELTGIDDSGNMMLHNGFWKSSSWEMVYCFLDGFNYPKADCIVLFPKSAVNPMKYNRYSGTAYKMSDFEIIDKGEMEYNAGDDTFRVSLWERTTYGETTYSKGKTKYGNVTSNSETAYPNNGHKDGYFYVKINPS